MNTYEIGRLRIPALFVCSVVLLHAQFIQQGSNLVGSDSVGPPWLGWSVALSADGNTALLGGPNDNFPVQYNPNQPLQDGAAWPFVRASGVWTQQGSKLVGTGDSPVAVQGESVALSADGNTALVGGQSAAWVFTRSGGVWIQQARLAGSGAVGFPVFISVALSADGNTAALGSPWDNQRTGAVWVFTRIGGVWTQQGGKLIGSGAINAALQGWSVALSASGNTMLVGGQNDDTGISPLAVGATWVFTRSEGVWTQQGGKLVGSGSAVAHQGFSVALSADGNTALVGGPYDSSVGAAWVFRRSRGIWTQEGGELVGTGASAGAYQGFAVALSGDGNTALIGGPYDSKTNFGPFDGAAWVFTRTEGGWTQQGNKLVAIDALSGAQQGWSVALSTDGRTALIGGPSGSDGGAAWVFVTNPPAPNAAPVTLSLISSLNPSTVGQTVTLTASLVGGSGTLTGTVQFFDGPVLLGSAPVTGGRASFATAALSLGSHAISAQYGSALGSVGQVVNGMTSKTMISVNPASVLYGQAVTLTAQVGPAPPAGVAAPTGPVTFQDNGYPIGTVALSSGTASLTLSATAVGTHPYTAIYGGDNTWGSSYARLSVTVTLPALRISNMAADVASVFAPDEAVSIFNVTILNSDAVASSLPLPASLGGITVTITDSAGVSRLAPLYGALASREQVNLVIPGETALGPASLKIAGPGGVSLSATMKIVNTAPGLFAGGQIIHVHGDGSQTIENFTGNPVNLGAATEQVFLVLYGTGIRHFPSPESLAVSISGKSVLAKSGLQGSYPGLDQVNVELPHDFAGSGAVSVILRVEDQAANIVNMVIQ
ncbi:MAG: hypothetical protein C5B51_11045 [Terriglobia bacterium]|nr:MAG: hypothetical protein C5B51_11045 [Terriglobia bacterium]